MHHTNETFHTTCTNLCDHHQLYPIPIALPAQHHISDLMDDLCTTLLYSHFELPNAPCHKPSCCMVRALSPVSLHMSLVLTLVYHLYLSCLYLPHKQEVFPQEFRFSSFCLIVSPRFASYFCLISYSSLASYSCTILHHLTLLAIALGAHPLPAYHTLRASLGSCFN